MSSILGHLLPTSQPKKQPQTGCLLATFQPETSVPNCSTQRQVSPQFFPFCPAQIVSLAACCISRGRVSQRECASLWCSGDFVPWVCKAALLAEREINDLCQWEQPVAPSVQGSHWFLVLLGNCCSIFLCQKPGLPDGAGSTWWWISLLLNSSYEWLLGGNP